MPVQTPSNSGLDATKKNSVAVKGAITAAPTLVAQPKQDNLKSSSEVILTAKPLQINLDTPTDWPATVITPIVIALAAAWFTWINQRFQVRSTIANFRHSWQMEFRSAIKDYIGSALEINMKCVKDADFLSSPDSEILITKIATSRAMIRVMLDKDKQYTTELVQLMDEISDNLDDQGIIFDDKITAFTNKSQQVLELAWIDIRRDLKGEKKKT